jgi:hypothetical protein
MPPDGARADAPHALAAAVPANLLNPHQPRRACLSILLHLAPHFIFLPTQNPLPRRNHPASHRLKKREGLHADAPLLRGVRLRDK